MPRSVHQSNVWCTPELKRYASGWPDGPRARCSLTGCRELDPIEHEHRGKVAVLERGDVVAVLGSSDSAGAERRGISIMSGTPPPASSPNREPVADSKWSRWKASGGVRSARPRQSN